MHYKPSNRPIPIPAGLAEEIAQKRAQILDAMYEAQTVGFLDPTTNPRQFVHGYVHLIEQAALGNETARDEYLSLIIPACKAAELPLGYILAVLVILDMALARVISPEFVVWHMAFCYDYTESLIEVWTQS